MCRVRWIDWRFSREPTGADTHDDEGKTSGPEANAGNPAEARIGLVVELLTAAHAVLPAGRQMSTDTFQTILFSNDPHVLAMADLYLRIAGPAFALFGLGHGLYFASQGSGKILGPVLAGTLRFAIIALGGWLLAINNAPAWMMFALVAVAMAVYGGACALAVYVAKWGK